MSGSQVGPGEPCGRQLYISISACSTCEVAELLGVRLKRIFKVAGYLTNDLRRSDAFAAPAAIHFTDPSRMSPAANTPRTVDSNQNGSRSTDQNSSRCARPPAFATSAPVSGLDPRA